MPLKIQGDASSTQGQLSGASCDARGNIKPPPRPARAVALKSGSVRATIRRSDRESLLLGTRWLRGVMLDRFFQQTHNQSVQRGFVFLGPARQLFVQGWRHADLKVNHSLGHRCISSYHARTKTRLAGSQRWISKARKHSPARESKHALRL